MASYILWCVLVPTCSIHHLKHKCWAQDMRWTYKAIYHPACCNSKAIGRYSRSHMCSRCKILIYIQLSPYGLLVVCRNVFFPRIASSDHRLSVLLHILHSCRVTSVRLWTHFKYQNLLLCLATGRHFVLLNDGRHPSGILSTMIYWSPWNPQELLTLSEVNRDSLIRTRCCRMLLHAITIFTLTSTVRGGRPRPHKEKAIQLSDHSF